MPDGSRRLRPKADTAGSPSRKNHSTPAGVAALWHPSGMLGIVGPSLTGGIGLTASTTGYRLGTLPGSSDAADNSDVYQTTSGDNLRRPTATARAIRAVHFSQAQAAW